MDAQTLIVFAVSAVLLTVFFYFGRQNGFYALGLHHWVGAQFPETYAADRELLEYSYWGAASLVLRVLIPIGIITLLFRRPLAEYGLTLRGVGKHARIYLALYLLMLPLLYVASQLPSFQATYPFYSRAAEGGARFWTFELAYALQFIGVEVFFRGFMTFGLAKRLGYYAVLIMTLPYTMIHFGKPMPEAMGAIVAGLALGYLALRTGSVVPGILIHWGVAFTMDVLSIVQKHGGIAPALAVLF